MAYTNINKGSDYFNTKLYTGTNATQSITGVGFQPDFTWFKRRDSAAQHSLFDSVSGVTKQLASNLTNAETTITDALSSFDSDGFTLGVDSGNYINFNGATYASWNWLANGAGSSNTDGSITSTVSANQTSGFSIVEYTGTGANATVGHGLGVTPAMMIVKRMETAGGSWRVYHKYLTATSYLLLETADASASQANLWNNTEPTSSVFTIGTAGDVNLSSYKHIAYCFAEKKGFSKFGSYTGNGNADGTFIYTGFKPAFLLYKCSSTGFTNWQVFDNKRSTYNLAVNRLNPNDSSVELATTADSFDLLSNGFKARNTGSNSNNSGDTYIYMAFAEFPIVSSSGVPCTAR